MGERFLHVANGTCTTNTIQAASIPGAVSIWADPLYEGPVPAGLSDEALMDVRSRYLAGEAGEASVDPVNDLRAWRRAIADHDAYDELLLWYEHDLFDQLNLIQVLTWIRGHVPAAKPVSLICIGSFPGRPAFKGLGELTPDELASLVHTRQRVSDAQYALAAAAWEAFRQPTPEPLEALVRADTGALPLLAPALARFFQEYPSTRDGLSRTEHRLLTLAAPVPLTLAAAFPRMQDGEDAYYVTDLSLMMMAAGFSRTSPPLVAIDPPDVDERQPLRARVTLTDAGRAVLRGELDRVAACGIDRWLGGVHLHHSAPLWRWDEARGAIVRAATI